MCNCDWVNWLNGTYEKYAELKESCEWEKFCRFLMDSVLELKKKGEYIDLIVATKNCSVILGGWYKIDYEKFEKKYEKSC